MNFTSKLMRGFSMLSKYTKMQSKILLAFDFDHTVMEGNTDVIVQDLAPGGVPEHIKSTYSTTGWTEYMGLIFKHLYESHVTRAHIEACMRGIPFVHGMESMLTDLDENLFDVIIISDSNSFFIKCILEHAGLMRRVAEVYTNPAQFDSNGCLNIEYYHTQDWCDLSTVNLCKGAILDQHIAEAAAQGVDYVTVGYVGDGSNDLCPSLRLRDTDVCYARNGFTLPKKIDKLPSGQLKAQVVLWNDGLDLRKEFQSLKSNLRFEQT